MTDFVNMTPHPINLHTGEGMIEIPPSGTVPRVEQNQNHVATTRDGVRLLKVEYGKVETFPYDADHYYIVSALYATAYRAEYGDGLPMLVVPADPVRDGSGRIVGCRAFGLV